MRSKTARGLTGLVVAVAIGGCASSGTSPTADSTARDVAEMKERILELQEQAAMTEVELERLQQKVLRLQTVLDPGAAGPSSGPVSPPSEEPAPSVSDPISISNVSEVVVEESDIDPEGAGAAAAEIAEVREEGAAETPSAAPDLSSRSLQPVEPAAQALYDRGYTLYHQGKYLDAEASFQRFLQAHPDTELSDNAQFWIGEARYARNDVQGAMAAFREVIQKYPQGNKVSDSLIKEGDCLERLGDRDGARDRYEEVQRRFPGTGAAVMAEDRLSKLDG